MGSKHAPNTSGKKKSKEEPRLFFATDKEVAKRSYRMQGLGYTKVARMFEGERE